MPPHVRGDVWTTAASFVSAGVAAAAHLREAETAASAGRKRKAAREKTFQAPPAFGRTPLAPGQHVIPPRVSRDRVDAPSSSASGLKAAAKAAAAAARGDGTFLEGDVHEAPAHTAAVDEVTQVAHSFLTFATSLLDRVYTLRDCAGVAAVAAQSRANAFREMCSPPRAQKVKDTKAQVSCLLDECEAALLDAEAGTGWPGPASGTGASTSDTWIETFSDCEADDTGEDFRKNRELDDAVANARRLSRTTLDRIKQFSRETAGAAKNGVAESTKAVIAFECGPDLMTVNEQHGEHGGHLTTHVQEEDFIAEYDVVDDIVGRGWQAPAIENGRDSDSDSDFEQNTTPNMPRNETSDSDHDLEERRPPPAVKKQTRIDTIDSERDFQEREPAAKKQTRKRKARSPVCDETSCSDSDEKPPPPPRAKKKKRTAKKPKADPALLAVLPDTTYSQVPILNLTIPKRRDRRHRGTVAPPKVKAEVSEAKGEGKKGKHRKRTPKKEKRPERERTKTKAKPSAPVALVLFSDFEFTGTQAR